jgi:hypothetical protein
MPDDYVNNFFKRNPSETDDQLVRDSQSIESNNPDSDINIWGQNQESLSPLNEDNAYYNEEEENNEDLQGEEPRLGENINTSRESATKSNGNIGESAVGMESVAMGTGEAAAVAGEAVAAGEATVAASTAVATSEIWIPIIIIAILLFILFFALIGFKKLGSTNTSGDGSSGGIITEPVNGTREELVDQILTMSNAGDIVVDPDSLANIKSDDLNINLLKLIITLAKEIKNHGGALQITCLMCAHDNDSFHNYGLAIDIDHSDTANYLMPWLSIPENVEILKINELIFNSTCSPISAVGEGAGNKYNLDEGAPFAYDDTTLSGHCDHIHIAVYSE